MATVTISRLPGAWGDALGEHLALRLGYRLIDRAALLDALGGLGLEASAADAPELSERAPSLLERLLQDRQRYLVALRRGVIQCLNQGNNVILGLGGGQVLRDLRSVVRIQVVAPTEVRAARLMAQASSDQRGRLSLEDAKHVLHRLDHERAAYMRYMFHIDWLDPQYWDVVVNTAHFSIPEAVAILATAAERADAAQTVADREHIADLELASRVEWRLLNDPQIWVSNLQVHAQAGRVSIDGEVLGLEEVDAVNRVVERIEGVRMVNSSVRLQPPFYSPI